jgi:alkylation response protein AidB-like acyl-CoA dehydrogenase
VIDQVAATAPSTSTVAATPAPTQTCFRTSSDMIRVRSAKASRGASNSGRNRTGVVSRALYALDVQAAIARCITVKHAAAHNAAEILQRLAEVNAGAAFGRALPFERMWRDVQAGPIMPMGSMAARQFVGATALGVEVAPVAP